MAVAGAGSWIWPMNLHQTEFLWCCWRSFSEAGSEKVPQNRVLTTAVIYSSCGVDTDEMVPLIQKCRRRPVNLATLGPILLMVRRTSWHTKDKPEVSITSFTISGNQVSQSQESWPPSEQVYRVFLSIELKPKPCRESFKMASMVQQEAFPEGVYNLCEETSVWESCWLSQKQS